MTAEVRCPECGGPGDERVLAGMKCAYCAYGYARPRPMPTHPHWCWIGRHEWECHGLLCKRWPTYACGEGGRACSA